MLREVGGFDCEAPVGEDILACAALLKAGYQSAYVSTAYVVHSHNYSFAQEYARYLQIGQMHAMRPDLLKTFGKPEGEGLRLIRAELKEALRIAPWVGIATLIRAAVKYLGYRRGRMLRA
jgi:rhamnosyltransferase